MIRVLGVGFDSAEGDVAGNVAGALETVRRAVRESPADLVVLPELFTCGYCGLDLTPWAEPLGGETVRRFHELARDLDCTICFGLAEAGDGRRVYNSCAVVEPGRPPAWCATRPWTPGRSTASGGRSSTAQSPGRDRGPTWRGRGWAPWPRPGRAARSLPSYVP